MSVTHSFFLMLIKLILYEMVCTKLRFLNIGIISFSCEELTFYYRSDDQVILAQKPPVVPDFLFRVKGLYVKTGLAGLLTIY